MLISYIKLDHALCSINYGMSVVTIETFKFRMPEASTFFLVTLLNS